VRVLWLNFYRKSRTNSRRRRIGDDESVQLDGVAHLDDLPRVLGHLLEDEAHLLVGQATVLELSLSEAAQKLGIAPAEADAVVVSRGLAGLLVSRLVFLIDADQSLDRPHGVGGELGLDEGDGVLLGGGGGSAHRANTLTNCFIKSKKKIKKMGLPHPRSPAIRVLAILLGVLLPVQLVSPHLELLHRVDPVLGEVFGGEGEGRPKGRTLGDAAGLESRVLGGDEGVQFGGGGSGVVHREHTVAHDL